MWKTISGVRVGGLGSERGSDDYEWHFYTVNHRRNAPFSHSSPQSLFSKVNCLWWKYQPYTAFKNNAESLQSPNRLKKTIITHSPFPREGRIILFLYRRGKRWKHCPLCRFIWHFLLFVSSFRHCNELTLNKACSFLLGLTCWQRIFNGHDIIKGQVRLQDISLHSKFLNSKSTMAR